MSPGNAGNPKIIPLEDGWNNEIKAKVGTLIIVVWLREIRQRPVQSSPILCRQSINQLPNAAVGLGFEFGMYLFICFVEVELELLQRKDKTSNPHKRFMMQCSINNNTDSANVFLFFECVVVVV